MFPKTKEEALLLFDFLLDKSWNGIEIIKNSKSQINSLTTGKDKQPQRYFELQDRWYSSIETEPDYSVYNDEYYLSEAFACWWVYAKRYLNDVFKKEAVPNNVHSVVDLGCGIGFSTHQLTYYFKNAMVYGTNIELTKQWVVCQNLSKLYNRFGMISETSLQHSDVIFASEYFEHFERPIEHLLKIIAATTPNYLIIANSFTARSIGHFNQYIINNEKIENKKVSKMFNQTLIDLGYKKSEVKFWNNRPMVWSK